LSYRYEHLWRIFGHVRARSYILICEVCETPYRIPAEAAYRTGHLERDPIPFLRRHGCLLLLAATLVAALIGWLSG
jgi:hypothetical protein